MHKIGYSIFVQKKLFVREIVSQQDIAIIACDIHKIGTGSEKDEKISAKE